MQNQYNTKMEILLLEDDALLAESLQEYLEMEGYTVECVAYGEEVFEKTFHKHYDLYILDINVPDINGLEVLKALKDAEDSTPAIYISAMTDIEHITQGFAAGAIDYIKKPFDPEELLVRIRHHLGTTEEKICYAEICYDPRNGQVVADNETFYLSEMQKKMFNQLILNQGEMVPIDSLLDSMDRPSTNALRVAITKLKKKMQIEIKNVRGQGYLIEAL